MSQGAFPHHIRTLPAYKLWQLPFASHHERSRLLLQQVNNPAAIRGVASHAGTEHLGLMFD